MLHHIALTTTFPWELLGWEPSAAQLDLFEQLQLLLQQWNSRLNLTRLVEGNDYWIGQVFDSLWPLQPWLQGKQPLPARLIDVGTGGGFPGLAAAIALPTTQVTLVDSVGRKLEAVGAMAQELGLAERTLLRCERAERTGQDPDCRASYQLALARAVAAAPVVAEYLVPLLSANGQALLYRGQWSEADGVQLNRAAKLLRARVEPLRALALPEGRGQRHVIPLSPVAPCPPAYPRAVGIPAKQPLA
jgi:16S rRNA (guanine527-N7)-methyltransferase